MRVRLALSLSLLTTFALPWAARADTQTFTYTGAEQDFVVPANVTAVTVSARGAHGGFSNNGAVTDAVGSGGTIAATVAVTPGETLAIYVGGEGSHINNVSTGGAGGFNGGAGGGNG